MKITVHTLTHCEAGIVAQHVEVEGDGLDVHQQLVDKLGFNFAGAGDYRIVTMEHEVRHELPID